MFPTDSASKSREIAMCDVGIGNDCLAEKWPALEIFCVHPSEFPGFRRLFACILTVSQRPHVICDSYTLLRPHLWEYPFAPYLYRCTNNCSVLRFCLRQESSAPILQSCVDILDCNVFTKLSWFDFIGFLQLSWWLKKSWRIRNDYKDLLMKQKTNDMACARLSVLYVLPAVNVLRIAGLTNIVNQHRTTRYFEGADCYSLQRKQS